MRVCNLRLESRQHPAVGTAAPEFTLKTNEGNQASLKDFRGTWVVLYFYPKDFTSGCTLQARNFQMDGDKYKAAKAIVLGISVDSAESHASFCQKEGLTFKLLSDTETKVSDAYGSLMEYNGMKLSARNTFIIDRRESREGLPEVKLLATAQKFLPPWRTPKVNSVTSGHKAHARKRADQPRISERAAHWSVG